MAFNLTKYIYLVRELLHSVDSYSSDLTGRYWIIFEEVSYYVEQETWKRKLLIFSLRRTSHIVVSQFPIVFQSRSTNWWRQEARRKRNVNGRIFLSRSSFVKRFASLAAAFPPMTLRLHVSTAFIDFIGSYSVAPRRCISYIVYRFIVAFGVIV